MKIFCSGSCRLLTTLRNTSKIENIHLIEEPNFKGINFLGKFHDTKSHIQFIKFIKGEVELDRHNSIVFVKLSCLTNILEQYNAQTKK
jgi:hypothetical protein